MKKNEKKKDFHLIHLLKSRNLNNRQVINIENEYENKDDIILNQLTYLNKVSLYFQELDRLQKLNNENLLNKNKKVVIKKKSNREIFEQLKKIVKGSSNKMFLDIIYNNLLIKNKLFSYDKKKLKKDKLKLKLNHTSNISNNIKSKTKYKFQKCHIDSLNILSNTKSNKNFKHSLSFSSFNVHPLFLKRKNNFFISKEFSKTNENRKNKDKYNFKGMITLNYNYKDKMINFRRPYSNYKYENINKRN